MNQARHIFNACFLLAIVSFSVYLIKYFLNAEEAVKPQYSIPVTFREEPSSKGKRLFQQNCQTCHSLDTELTGPALRGFTSRGPWKDKREIYKWIKNPAAYIKQNEYASNLQKKYGAIMQSFELTNEEIDHIVDYINSARIQVKYMASR